MRPDEHKKKKSAQYQRKQSGLAAKGEKSENDRSSSKPGKQVSSRNEDPQHSRRGNRQTKLLPSPSSSESEQEDGEQHETHAKTFSRRQITSNWTKYDLPPADVDDAAITPKGQDFHKLMQSAGGATSHFRFKDEENWEDGATESGPAAHVLSLDCADLATSLNCLPLYTQLGLDMEIFTPEQRAAMKKTAEENRKTAGLPDPKPKKVPPTTTNSARSPSNPAASSTARPAPPSDPRGAVAARSRAEELEGTSVSRDSAQGMSARSRDDPSGSVGLTDTDLDSLLESEEASSGVGDRSRSAGAEVRLRPSEGQGSATSMTRAAGAEVGLRPSEGQGSSTPMTRLAGAEVGSRSSEGQGSASAASQEVAEQDLDDLLAMETPTQSSRSTPISNTAPKKTESKIAAESAELEDWLDSVLDD